MKAIQKILLSAIKILLIVYILICILLYFFQEKLIFFPQRLPKDHSFSFPQPFQEFNIPTRNQDTLNALLFTSSHPKGLIFYLHGNAGSLEDWGEVAKAYTDLDYDVFMPDYPGYGKSTGSIKSKNLLFEDIQNAYDVIKTRYREDDIVILGYSIGTGPAAWLASGNHPRLLILQAPYYNLSDMMKHSYPIIPTFLLKYNFHTNEYLKKCTMPLVVFHGDEDEVIYYGSSLKLQKEFKPADTLITLHGQGHNGMSLNPEYLKALTAVLRTPRVPETNTTK